MPASTNGRKNCSSSAGVCASFTVQKRRELVEFLAPYRENALANHPWREWAAFDEGGSARELADLGDELALAEVGDRLCDSRRHHRVPVAQDHRPQPE